MRLTLEEQQQVRQIYYETRSYEKTAKATKLTIHDVSTVVGNINYSQRRAVADGIKLERNDDGEVIN